MTFAMDIEYRVRYNVEIFKKYAVIDIFSVKPKSKFFSKTCQSKCVAYIKYK